MHQIQSLTWAQRFSSVDGVEDLIRGKRLCAEFLRETAALPGVSQALQAAALEAAAVLAMRSGAEQASHFPWAHVLEQARAILDGLTAPASVPRSESGGP